MTPETFLAEFLEAFNNLETDRFVTMFAEDSTVFFPMRFRERTEGGERTASWRAHTMAFVRRCRDLRT